MSHKIPSSIYKKHFLELYKNPSNFGILKNATHSRTEYNSVCGDEITMQLIIKNNLVKDAKFSGSGCILSIVSASLLTNRIKGKELKEIKKLDKQKIIKMLKIKVSNSRIKCAMLPLEAVKKALK